ncbi:hypothetical protein PoB_007185300 [Plakobranchus ocellatus]|uniref:Uncharacterized protein n=1 Tax=Plakobranchus ocellatus TaxID=259542 RepID=A0AAV4DLZ5_9GAST|nr:hypothetical protein PoB_007185300 [Plakobranchus ocellatus]
MERKERKWRKTGDAKRIGTHADRNMHEAALDNILISKVVLPDNKVVENIYFGWDNFVMDEIERLIWKYHLGRPENYEMSVTTDKGTVVFESRRGVEFYRDELLDHLYVSLKPIAK